MNEYITSNKGSEWRKWDLHVHTPNSLYQNFGPNSESTWESYILDLEKLPLEFSVLGINDYFFLDGYEKLKDEKLNNGRIKNIDLLLPVVEFRIDKFAGIDFGPLKRINLHVIFSDELSTETIKSQFLNTLEQSYYLESGLQWTRAITYQSVEELGKEIKKNIPDEQLSKYGSNLIEGFNNLNVKEDSIFEALDKDCFKGKYLIAIGKTEWGELKWTDASIATKKSIINRADIVFTASKSISDFHKAKDQLTKQSVNDLLLDCSDAHFLSDSDDKDRIGNCFTWIKSNPTFEGLKQILFEPELRVSIQENLPEEKVGYQVIERIEINCPHIYNSVIELNPNLNSIIGGRSTGKSVLLAAIAKKLKTEKPVIFLHNPDYNSFVESISRDMTIFWKDGENQNEREIEYFEQGYMYDLSRDDKKLSSLIQNILIQQGKESIISDHNKVLSDNKKMISDNINDYFITRSEINDRDIKILEKGDKLGIEEEINKLTKQQRALNVNSYNEQEKSIHDSHKAIIDSANKNISTSLTDIGFLQILKTSTLFKELNTTSIISISDAKRRDIELIFNRLRFDFEIQWRQELDKIISTSQMDINNSNRSVSSSSSDPTFLKVDKIFLESRQLRELQERIKMEKDKLSIVIQLTKEREELSKKILNLKQKIKDSHKEFYKSKLSLIDLLSDSKDELNINAVIRFDNNRYKDILQSALNLQSASNQALANFDYQGNDLYENHVFSILDKLLDKQMTLKSGYSNESLITALLADTFYQISYDIMYEGDDFLQMSDGKKAFVVLKLLLDFSNKKCPILIDQPEDDLDNRAIYNDLVKYLRNKKSKRQIILATHNPNIVVAADSELVIVANQHGLRSSNREEKKFQYSSGSLENSFTNDSQTDYILESQGIREHVCEILEGGRIAFKLREKKYGLPI